MLSHVLTELDTRIKKPGFTYLAETDWSYKTGADFTRIKYEVPNAYAAPS